LLCACAFLFEKVHSCVAVNSDVICNLNNKAIALHEQRIRVVITLKQIIRYYNFSTHRGACIVQIRHNTSFPNKGNRH